MVLCQRLNGRKWVPLQSLAPDRCAPHHFTWSYRLGTESWGHLQVCGCSSSSCQFWQDRHGDGTPQQYSQPPPPKSNHSTPGGWGGADAIFMEWETRMRTWNSGLTASQWSRASQLWFLPCKVCFPIPLCLTSNNWRDRFTSRYPVYYTNLGTFLIASFMDIVSHVLIPLTNRSWQQQAFSNTTFRIFIFGQAATPTKRFVCILLQPPTLAVFA